MDKIREHFFAISVGLLGVGLLVLIFVMIIQPRFLSDLGDVAALERKKGDLERYNDKQLTKQLPRKELLEASEERNEKVDAELSSALKMIEEKDQKFEQFLSSFVVVPQPGVFQPTYQTEITKLIQEYQKKYPEALPEEAPPGQSRRRDADPGLQVSQIVAFTSEADVRRGMKELWMIQQFFKSANDLDLGGLKKIDFPLRNKRVEGLPEFYDAVWATVEIQMPLRMLGEYIASVYDSERVPFELVKLSVARLPETLIPQLVKVVSYGEGNAEDARRQEELEAHPGAEPRVRVTMDFHGIDWKGFPDKAPGGSGKKG